MHVFGTVIDQSTKQPVPFATVMLVTSAGQFLAVNTQCDQFGRFSLESNYFQPGTNLQITSAEYHGALIPYDQYTTQEVFTLSNKIITLGDVVVTAPALQDTGKKLLLWGAVIVAAYFTFKKQINRAL